MARLTAAKLDIPVGMLFFVGLIVLVAFAALVLHEWRLLRRDTRLS